MVEIGEHAPKVRLFDTDLKKVDLSKPKDNKPTVLAFFPGAFTSVCTKEMCTLRDGLERLSSSGANLIAISVDGPFANKEFKEKHNLSFPVLSDYKRKAVKKFDIQLKDFAGMKGYTAAKRSVFVLDASGNVKYKWVSDDPMVEPNYEEVQAAVSR